MEAFVSTRIPISQAQEKNDFEASLTPKDSTQNVNGIQQVQTNGEIKQNGNQNVMNANLVQQSGHNVVEGGKEEGQVSQPTSQDQLQPSKSTPAPLDAIQMNEEAEKRLLNEEEERRKAARKTKKGRIRELEEIRGQLAEKELILLAKEKELLEKEQSIEVLLQELELERKLRALLTKEKERAEEEAALASGLCIGGFP